MIEVLELPEDDYSQVKYEKYLQDFDRNYFDTPRSDNPVFINLSFNNREAEVKKKLFDSIAEHLTPLPGIPIEDIYMNIIECAPANWWVFAKTVNPKTGFDSRTAKASD